MHQEPQMPKQTLTQARASLRFLLLGPTEKQIASCRGTYKKRPASAYNFRSPSEAPTWKAQPSALQPVVVVLLWQQNVSLLLARNLGPRRSAGLRRVSLPDQAYNRDHYYEKT